MKIGKKIALIVCFFVVLTGLVWAGALKTTDTASLPASAKATPETVAKKEKETRPPLEATQPVVSKLDKGKLKTIDKNVTQQLKDIDFNGTFLIAVGDEVIYHKAMGYSDVDKKIKNTLDTKYEIGSCTKQFTATAVAKLADEGKLSLDDKISKYIKNIKTGKDIKIEQLMNMCSGLPDYLNEYIYSVENAEREEDSTLSQKEFINWINDHDTIFEPGEYFSYCNSNYYILGMIIEEVTGKSYESYIHDEIFYPLYMDNSSLKMTDTSCTGYLDSDFASGIKIDSSYFYSAGEIVSTSTDMLRWLNAYTRGGVLSDKMFAKATNTGTDGFNYGYGWFVTDDYAYHTGNTELFYAVDIFTKKDDIKIVGLTNVNNTTLQPTALSILSEVENCLFPENHGAAASQEPTNMTE